MVTTDRLRLPPGLRALLTALASLVPDLFDVADRTDRGRLLLRIGVGAYRAVDLTADDAHHVALLRAAHGALTEAAQFFDAASYEAAECLHYLGLTLVQIGHLTRDLDSARKAVAALETAAEQPVVQELERHQRLDFSSAIAEATWLVSDLDDLRQLDFEALAGELGGVWELPARPVPDFDRLTLLTCGALDVVSLEAWLDEVLGTARRRSLWEQISIILTGDAIEDSSEVLALVGRERTTTRDLRALPDEPPTENSGSVEIVLHDPMNPSGGGFVMVRFFPRGEGDVRLLLEEFGNGKEIPGWHVQVTLADRLDTWRVTTDEVGEAILEGLIVPEAARGAIVVVEPPDAERSWYLLRGSLIRMLDRASWSTEEPSRLSLVDAEDASVGEVEVSSVTLGRDGRFTVVARVEGGAGLDGRTVALDLAPGVAATGSIQGTLLRLEQTLDAEAVASALAAVPGTQDATRELRIPRQTALRLM